MYVNKKLMWMVPYVERALLIIPDGKSVTRLGAFTQGGRYGKGAAASIHTHNHRHYRIYLHTHMHPRYSTDPMPYSKIDLLHNLAHELAHMLDMDHTPAHKKLEARLVTMFMTMLKKSGYHSEEKELG